MVTVRSRLFASDEENAKRNDDYRPSKTGSWDIRNRPIWKTKRVAGILAACLCVWLFIHFIPTDIGHANQRRRPQYSRNNPSRAQRAIPKAEYQYQQEEIRETAPEPGPVTHAETPLAPAAGVFSHTYDGPVKFFNLATSLNGIAKIVDYRPGNRHVLFAASDLNSLAAILPTACEMSKWKRNNVHVAIMGREDLPLEEIIDMNGASYKSCPVYWHDARPDLASTSTDGRMQLSVSGALGHINTYMLPRALITADADHENVYFSVGVSRTARALGITHISIPKEHPDKLSWLARLDASSLNSWYSASFDVLVQAPLDSSGSLIRLLNSLSKADYTGSIPPRLIVELPHTIDLATKNFLTAFRWPPFGTQTFGQGDQLVIRRRISEQHVAVEEASRRFIESYYPASPRGPHVLLLSSQVELSPTFFQYLKLHLLEYRHSYTRPNPARNMFGISLETPSTHLNASSEFVVPLVVEDSGDEGPSAFEPFCWQAPNSNAALYFSDKWIELHSFMTKRRTASLHSRTKSHHTTRAKLVSSKQPSWMEYALDLMRARGYYLHYPGIFFRHTTTLSDSSFSSAEQALAIVHNELYQPPEEYLHPSVTEEESTSIVPRAPAATVFTVSADYLASHHPSESASNSLNDERPLLKNLNPLLPELVIDTELEEDSDMFNQEPQDPLPPLQTIPLLDYLGTPITKDKMEESSSSITRSYRRRAGGCTDAQSRSEEREPGSAEDLFCLEDDDTISKLADTSAEFTKAQTSDAGKRVKSAAGKSNKNQNSKEEEHVEPEEVAETPALKTAPTKIHGSEGAAAVVNRVVDADTYLATAKAGFAKKLADKEKVYEPLPLLESKKLALTDDEKKWLEEHKDAEETEDNDEDVTVQDEEEGSTEDGDLADEHHEVHVNIPPEPAPLQDTDSNPTMRGPQTHNDNDDEFFRLVTNGRGKDRDRKPATPPKPVEPPKAASKISKATSDTELSGAAATEEAAEKPRDAPSVDKQALPAAGQTFEEQMNARDAAKKDSLNDRDRAMKTRMRVGGDVDPEVLPNAPADSGLKRTGPEKGTLRIADETEEELVVNAAPLIPATVTENTVDKSSMRVSTDKDAEATSFAHPPGKPDMHPGHLNEEDERLGTGEGQVAHAEVANAGETTGGKADGERKVKEKVVIANLRAAPPGKVEALNRKRPGRGGKI